MFRKDPGKSDLGRRSTVLLGNLVELVYDLEVLREVLFRPARKNQSEVIVIKISSRAIPIHHPQKYFVANGVRFSIPAGYQTTGKRAVGDDGNA